MMFYQVPDTPIRLGRALRKDKENIYKIDQVTVVHSNSERCKIIMQLSYNKVGKIFQDLFSCSNDEFIAWLFHDEDPGTIIISSAKILYTRQYQDIISLSPWTVLECEKSNGESFSFRYIPETIEDMRRDKIKLFEYKDWQDKLISYISNFI